MRRHLAAFLRRHKTTEEAVAETIGLNLVWTGLRYLGVGGASIAAAAVLAPSLIDLSNNNGPAAAVAISAPGVQAVEAKGTEGLNFRDGDYPTFRAAAAKQHRAFGAYLFLHANESGAAQADFFLAYTKPKAGDIDPVVDSETGTPASAAPATYDALHELARKGYRPILYASSSFAAGLVAADPRLGQFPEWVAEYGPTLHTVPHTTAIAWQFTDRSSVHGLAVDGSHLLVRDLTQIEIPATTAGAKLRAAAGYWAWLAWYLGEEAWKPYGRHDTRVRPHAPLTIPKAWWRHEHAFVAARARR